MERSWGITLATIGYVGWFDEGNEVAAVLATLALGRVLDGRGSVAHFGSRVREQTGQRRRPLYLHARLNHRGEDAGAARDVHGE